MIETMLFRRSTVSLTLCGALIACAPDDGRRSGAVEDSLAQASALLDTLARDARERFRDVSFEEFKDSVYREPFEGGKFIVNGDTPILDEKHLREFYENRVQRDPDLQAVALVVHQVGGMDAVWNSEDKVTLTYCVSTGFGLDHEAVVQAMESAADGWEAVAAVDFQHVEAQDADCSPSNDQVVFDVRGVDAGAYLARAFFPNEPRGQRNVLIDQSALELDPGGNLQLVGVLRHELGHALGFRHEHTRPEAGRCFEDSNWRPLVDYDPFSVMHYPQCNGLGDWTLTLTAKDKSGAACVYGAASGFEVDSSLIAEGAVCYSPLAADDGTPEMQEFADESVARGEEIDYGPFSVTPGTLFIATISGSGDPDLYVRFRWPASRYRYDCRPYLYGASESCALDVPAGQTEGYVMVRGYDEATYDVEVTHAPQPD